MSDVRDYNLNRWGFVDDSGTLITIASSNVSIDELNSILGTINIVPNDDNYVLMVNGREAGVISITSQLKLKNVVYNPDTQSIEFTFESDEGEKKVSVDVHELVDVYTAGQGLGVDKNQFFIKIDPSSEKYLSVSENGIKISGLDTLLKNLNETLANFGQETAKAFDQINNVLETSINTINGGIDNEIRPAIAKNADDISTINEALLNKVEYTDVATSENPGRKAIVLKNHDTILGNTKNGTSVNIAMVSKWDKVDLGSAQVSINLNGKDERPTYNDEKEIALLEDVQGLGATIVLEKTNDLQYTLKVGDAIVGTIDIPKDQFVKSVSYNEESKTIDFVFETTDGEQTVTVNVSDLVDTYTAGNGVSLTSNEFSLKIDATTQQYIEVSAEGLKIVNIDEKLAEKVGLVDIATEENPNRKAIVLKNHDTILGTTTEGATQNLIMMSKWNKVDVGTASNELNLNGSAEHPTYNDERELAFVDEIPSVEGLASEEWVNAQGFLKEHQDISHLAEKADLDAEIEARSAADTQLQKDLESEAEARKSADDEIKLELEDKVEYTDISDGENPNRKTIQLNNHDSISGLDTSGVGYNLAMVSKWNKADFGSVSLPINLNGSEERPTYNDDEEIALMKDIEEIKLPIEFNFPLRTLQDKVYTQKEIFAWFGVADAAELKTLIVREGQFYLKYGIQLSGNPYYYRMPIQYIAFESANQIKMVVIGLDTTNDMPTKYEIILNLDGTIAEGNSNIKVTSSDLAFATDMPSLDGYATKDEVDKIKDDLEQFKAPYQIDLNALNSAGDADSEAISTAIGGIDNLRAVVSENRSIIGDINNGTVPVSIRILGNITTVYYVLDSLAGYTLNEINIQNTSGTLAKNSVTHSVMSEEMVVDNLTSNESTLPLSAKQGKVLDEKIQKKGMYYPGVKVDTQKLFALTKESSEDDIKAALQLETASGSYTLPTAEILDDCLGKGYQLLSNWMPVSIVWNGAAYVFYIVGQNYMRKPTGLYTVALSITEDGKYSVFQAAKCEEFASEYTVNNLIDEKLITVNNAITLLNDKVSILENKYNMILEENSESVADFVGGDTINDTTKSYSVSNANIESYSTINAKNIVLNDSTLSNNARLKVNSNNIEVNNLNISGNFPKENGNSVISLNDADYVVFKDMTFNSNNVYNGVEIGLNSEKLPKNILFENCKFEGTFSNNAILVFGTQNDATITLSNCTFDKLSNALRLSNKSNASGVTVNIINCSVNQWEETNKEYGGFLICEDYTSDASSVDSNNLFGNGKITVNFMNLTHKGEKVIYSNASKCCGTKDENQVVYVYANNVGFVNYSEDKYPIVTFK